MHAIRSFRARLLAVLAAAALVLSGCSGTTSEGQAPPPPSGEQPAINAEPAAFNAADITFAFDTITLHRQSIELSALVPDRSTDPDVVALASEISAVQGSEMEVMKVLLVQWGETPNADEGPGGQGSAIAGLVDDATVARLQSLSGNDFDTLWLQSMIGLQRGAVAIADAEIANGTNVDAVATARRIVETQQAQIAQMQQLLGTG